MLHFLSAMPTGQIDSVPSRPLASGAQTVVAANSLPLQCYPLAGNSPGAGKPVYAYKPLVDPTQKPRPRLGLANILEKSKQKPSIRLAATDTKS